MQANTLPGTSLAKSDEIGRARGADSAGPAGGRRDGAPDGRAEYDEHVQGVEAAEIDVGLQETDRPREELLVGAAATVRHAARDERDDRAADLASHRPHAVRHAGEHRRQGIRRRPWHASPAGRDACARRWRRCPGVVDLSLEQQMDVPFVRFVLNRSMIARYGLRPDDVAEAIETSLAGATVGRIFDRGAAFDLHGEARSDGRSEIRTDRGSADRHADRRHRARSASLADVRREEGPNMVLRENVQRRIVISCNVAGRDLGSVVDDIQAGGRVRQCRCRPATAWSTVGSSRASRARRSGCSRSACVVIAGLFMLLVLAFGRARDALIVMVNLPLALIGGVVGVFLSGGVLNVATMIGFITLFGIATRNGIMLVSHIHHLMSVEGVTDFREAVERGARERLVPILMTAMAAGLALIPLALGGGQTGSEIQTPMAIVILCGLTTSTLLNMFVVPTLYLRYGQVSERG